MSNLSLRLSLTVLLCLGVSFLHGEPEERERPIVVVSIPPYAGLVERLVEDRVEVALLVSPGGNHETFSPTASHVRTLGRASLFFKVGFPYETVLAQRLEGGSPRLEVVDLRSQIRLRTLEEDCHGEHHPHGEDDAGKAVRAFGLEHPDPHHWLSPRRLRIQVDQMARHLITLFPDEAGEIRANARRLIDELEMLDSEVEDLLFDYRDRAFLVYHPAFGYFADDYRLQQRAVEIDGRDPTPRQLRSTVLQAREEGIRVVFVQPQFNEAAAQRVAGAIGGFVMQLDPLYPDVIENIRAIAQSLEYAWSRED